MFPSVMFTAPINAIAFSRGWTQHILKTICLVDLMKESCC